MLSQGHGSHNYLVHWIILKTSVFQLQVFSLDGWWPEVIMFEQFWEKRLISLA